MFFCALSGEPPQDPVVSSKSGHVYERRLITKYIAENGADPITGEKLAEDDLIAVKASPNSAAPRPPNLTSIPVLLHTLQNEWDALVLEQFSLKQQNNAIRQELSHSLYQYDSATRVIARLLKERDSAREALASVQATMGVAPSEQPSTDVEMSDAPAETSGALPTEISAIVEDTQKTLSTIRKKKAKPAATYTTATQLRNFTSKHTIPSLHSPSPAGVTSLAVSRVNPSQFITGGNDKIVQVYDRDTSKVLATLKGHTKKVNHVEWREKEGETSLVISGSADKTVRIWGHDASSNDYAPNHTVKIHKGEISGVAVHPSSAILALSSLDKTYSLHNLSTFQSIFQSSPSSNPYTSLSIHPDGVLLGLGTAQSTMHIYDIRSGELAVELTPAELPANAFSVNTSAFSENGFHLAFPDTPSSVSVWDLRKPKMVTSFPLATADSEVSYKINKIRYDTSAQFLGVAGSDLRVFANKTWDELVKFEEGGEVSDFTFGFEAKEIWGAAGREVRLWAEKDQ